MALTIHPLVTAYLAMEAGRSELIFWIYGKRKWVPCAFYAILGGE